MRERIVVLNSMPPREGRTSLKLLIKLIYSIPHASGLSTLISPSILFMREMMQFEIQSRQN